MIRKTYIIKKEHLFDIVLDPFVKKIELNRKKMSNLDDPLACRVYVYLKVSNYNWGHFFVFLEKLSNLLEEGMEKQFVLSLASCKTDCFIRSATLLQLANLVKARKRISWEVEDLLKRLNRFDAKIGEAQSWW